MNRTRRHRLELPELGLGAVPMVVSSWLVPRGAHVIAGDRVLQILAGAATVDLPAPASGILIRQSVPVGRRVEVGQLLAQIESDEDELD